MGSDFRSMTDTAKSFLADTLKINPNTVDENGFNEIKSKLKEKLINSYESEYKQTYNYADENADLSRKQNAQQFSEKQKLEKQKAADANNFKRKELRAKYGGKGEDITANSFMYSGVMKKSTGKIPVGAKAYNVSDNKLVISPTKGVDEVVEEIFVKGTDVYIRGKKYTSQGDGVAPVEEEFVIDTKGESSKAGRFISELTKEDGKNYKNWNEFVKDLSDKTGTQKTASEYGL